MQLHIDNPVNVPFASILVATRKEVFSRFNTELRSLDLPEDELFMPNKGGFDHYFLNGNQVMGGYFALGAQAEPIRWGNDEKARVLRALEAMDDIARFLR